MADTFRADLFQGRHVFVTGGSSGINLGIATAFGRHGAKVSINGRNPEKLAQAVQGLTAQRIAAQGFGADVRDFAALDKAMGDAVAVHGPIDVLVCGAAGNFPAPAMAISSNGFKAVMDIDVLGTFHACRAGFEKLHTPGACILNITAPQSTVPWPMQAHVCAAKAGVDMLTRTLALEWGPAGVRVNGIVPGPIDGTEGMARLAGGDGAKEKLAQGMPMQRLGTVEDVANLALFLASPAASYVTGSIHACDGGMTLLGGTGLMQLVS